MNQPEVTTIDIGSTKLKMDNGWQRNLQSKQTEDAALLQMAYMEPQEFGSLIKEIKVKVGGHIGRLGIVGRSHNMVVVHKNGNVEVALIGDEPSLTPLGGIPAKLEPYYPESTTPPESLARKLSGVLTHPEIPMTLFGESIDPSNLYFSTLLSYLASQLVDRDLGIFPGEAKDFKRKEVEEKGNTVTGIFGLPAESMKFAQDESATLEDSKVWVMPDIKAEFRVLNRLKKNMVIPDGAWMFATDGVLKRVREAEEDGVKTLEDWYYDTMRRMGNTGPKAVFPVMSKKGIVNGLNDMFSKFEESMRDSEMPTHWFYDPRANKQAGRLWHKNGRGWVVETETDLINRDDKDFLEAVKAYGWGMACAMYEGTPPQMEDAVIYGGLMCLFGDIQPGWGHVFVKAAPEKTMVHWLKMTDAGQALKLLIQEEEGEKVNWSEQVPIQKLSYGGGMVEVWKEIKGDISAQGVYL